MTPAGYAFSIWSLIYLALAVFVVYQLLPAQRNRRLDTTRRLFVLSSVFNVAWLFSWHYLQIPLSQVMMFGLLFTLIAIYVHVRRNPDTATGYHRWITRVPFSLYLGWISVASLVNSAVVLYDLGPLQADQWNVSWTVIVLAVLTLLTLWILRAGRDVVFAGVALWAFIGILVANQGETLLVVAATAAAVLVALGIIFAFTRNRDRPLLS